MEKKNEPVYITKDGDILRDLPAAVAIVRKDVEETLQKTGISEYLSKSEEEKDRLREVMEGGSEKTKAIEKATDDSICGRTVKDQSGQEDLDKDTEGSTCGTKRNSMEGEDKYEKWKVVMEETGIEDYLNRQKGAGKPTKGIRGTHGTKATSCTTHQNNMWNEAVLCNATSGENSMQTRSGWTPSC